MLNNEEDMLDCARCKCTQNLLQCTAYRCNFDVSVMFVDGVVKKNNSAASVPTNIDAHRQTTVETSATKSETIMNGSSLPDLISFVHTIETLAYKYYVNALIRNGSYQLVYKDVDDIKHSSEESNNQVLNGISSTSTSNNKQRVIVFKSSPNRILGLYFIPPKSYSLTSTSSSSTSLKFLNYSTFFVLLFSLEFIKYLIF